MESIAAPSPFKSFASTMATTTDTKSYKFNHSM